MLKFLFGGRKDAAPVVETQRQLFERLQADLNDAIDTLPTKPKVTIDPVTGHISLELPEQLPDEALALPAPNEAATEEDATSPVAETDAPDVEKPEDEKKVA